jgi:hypothetical protein
VQIYEIISAPQTFYFSFFAEKQKNIL